MKKLDNTITIEMDLLPFSLDPVELLDYNSLIIADLIYTPLLSKNSIADLIKTPLEKITDRKYKIRIKRNYWTDNSLLTTSNVVLSLKRFYGSKSPYKWILDNFDNQVFNYGIEEIDELTFNLHLKEPTNLLTTILSSHVFTPSRKIQNGNIEFFKGRYCIKNISSNTLVLEKNNTKCNFGNIIFLINTNANIGLKLFKQNNIQLTTNTNFPLEKLNCNALNISNSTLNMTCQLWLNNENLSIDIRESILLAINAKKITSGFEKIASPIDTFSDIWYSQNNSPKTHFESPPKKNNQEFRIHFPDYELNHHTAKTIAELLFSVIGLKLELIPVSLEDNTKVFIKKKYDLLLNISPIPLGEPFYLYKSLLGTSNIESNPYTKRLMNQLQNENNPKRKNELIKSIERNIIDQKVVKPLFQLNNVFCSAFGTVGYNNNGLIKGL
jgi:ABC-type transport system substrate-binding protein